MCQPQQDCEPHPKIRWSGAEGLTSKARQVLGWKLKRSFAQHVEEMVASDLAETKRDAGSGKHTI